MKKIKLQIVGLSYSQTQSGAYALVLGEVKGTRRLPIVIGAFEAQAIAIEIEKMIPSRPLTHDLFKTFADTFKIKLDEILIYNLVDGVFYAKLICSDGKSTHEIDARSSDAIALAVRFDVPIFTYEFILSTAGITIDPSENIFYDDISSLGNQDQTADEFKPSKSKTSSEYQSLSIEELQALLDEALASEAYEKAAAIRDEMARKRKS